MHCNAGMWIEGYPKISSLSLNTAVFAAVEFALGLIFFFFSAGAVASVDTLVLAPSVVPGLSFPTSGANNKSMS